MQESSPTLKIVSTQPTIPALPPVATLPATPALPDVATLPATATLPAVATLPATATLPPVATLPTTARLLSDRTSSTSSTSFLPLAVGPQDVVGSTRQPMPFRGLRRYLCDDDRRGIYSTLTREGKELLEPARPVLDRTLEEALDAARADSELAPLVDALHALPHP